MKKVKSWQIEYKGKIYETASHRTSVGNIPCSVCVWGKDSKCCKPKDFDLNCREFGYIVEVGSVNSNDYKR